MNAQYKLSFVVLTGLVLMGGLFLWYLSVFERQTEVVFLNVGQGDAILISQGKNQILIDGGRTGKELLAQIGRHVPFWDRNIEFVIATHPDADHIGGLPSLFRTYEVDHVLTTGAQSDTETSRFFEEALSETHFGLTRVSRGAKITLPRGGELSIEYPLTFLSAEASDTNEGSIVSRFTYGETSFLLTGDLPHEETVLHEEGTATVLKVAHHGSKYSTSDAFLDLVEPKEAVVSVGKNSYGHPDSGVLERLEKRRVIVRRTDQEGALRYGCSEDACRFIP